eukprot:jgi/Orpsp1_1/1189539/evm.model.d7180000072722.1
MNKKTYEKNSNNEIPENDNYASPYLKNKSKGKLIDRIFISLINIIKFSLNFVAKDIEYFKEFVEKQLDTCNKKMLIIKILIVVFIIWYVRRLFIKNKLNKNDFDIYLMESGNYTKKSNKKSSMIYDYDNNNTNDNVVYLFN